MNNQDLITNAIERQKVNASPKPFFYRDNEGAGDYDICSGDELPMGVTTVYEQHAQAICDALNNYPLALELAKDVERNDTGMPPVPPTSVLESLNTLTDQLREQAGQ